MIVVLIFVRHPLIVDDDQGHHKEELVGLKLLWLVVLIRVGEILHVLDTGGLG